MPVAVVKERQSKVRALGYAAPKSGKTRWATSLPDSFGQILYVAEDDNSETLGPVLDKYKSRITVVKSVNDYSKTYDPVAEVFDIAVDWKKYCPEAGTIVWDTMSATGDRVLQFIAEKAQFSGQHIVVGAPSGPGRFVVPMQGDYGGAQNCITRLTSFLMQLPLHVIVLCHERLDEASGGQGIEGGPATVGNATVRTYSKPFDITVRLEKKTTAAPGQPSKTTVTAFTERVGVWQASIREGGGVNRMPRIELEPDPINFWNQLLGGNK